MRSNLCVLALAAGGVLCVAEASFAGIMLGLGDLPNGTSSSFVALSADGSTVVTSSSGRGFRWRSASGWVDLGDSGAGAITVGGVSGDGSVVTGAAVTTRSGVTGDYPAAWRDGTWAFLPRPSSTVFGRGVANAVSADGSRIAARIDNTTFVGRSWMWSGTEYELSDDFSLVNDDSHVEDMSGDGSMIVGWGAPPANGDRASVNPPGGAAGRIAMPDGSTSSVSSEDLRAFAISAAGTVIVGSYRTDDSAAWQVWKRVSGGATTLLGPGEGVDVSQSGIIAAGDWIYGADGAGSSAAAFLSAHGADVSAWTGLKALGVSDDGLTFSGVGLHEIVAGEFVSEAWVATIPTPGSVLVLGLAGVAAARRRR